MTTESNLKKDRNLVRRHPLASFFVLSYLFFVVAILIIGAVVSLTTVSAIAMGLLIAFASWTPNVAAVVVAGVTGGRASIRRLFAGWLKWRVNLWLYVVCLAPLAIAFASAGLYSLFGNTSAPTATSQLTASGLISMLFFHAIQGATGEELGWRGFALPALQRRFSPLVSAVVLGLVVSGWHGLLHLASPAGVPEWQFWIVLVSYSVIATWAYNRSKGSVLIATVFHFAFNFSLELVSTGLALVPLEILFWIETAIYAGFAVILIIATGKKL
jgi:uncharacterized protein